MSRIVQFAKAGGPEVLEFSQIDVPAPAAGEVRIRVKALGINRAEAMWRENAYVEQVAAFPARLGYEASGIVEAVGSGVESVALGDAVSTIPSFSLNKYGMYGEVVLAPVHAVVKNPDWLSHKEAASVWMMFVTAYGPLIEDAKVGPGDTVLITAASSSVGLAAIQIANMAGAVTVALTRTGAKRQKLLDIGAKHVIATEEQDLLKEVARITNGKGARVVLDSIGGPNFPKLIQAMAPMGLLYAYGALSEAITPLPMIDLVAKLPTIKGHSIGLTSGNSSRRLAAVDFVLNGLHSGALRTVIDKVFAFDEIVEAHRYLEANDQFGKIVITV